MESKLGKVQLEMPGVSPVDTVVESWMNAFRGTPEYEKHRGQYALFDVQTGAHVGFRSLRRESGDDRFSQNSEEEISVRPGTRVEFIH